jgi:hypothetical protein
MSITLVQQVATASSTPTVTCTLNGVAGGDLLVAPFNCGVGSVADITVSDNNGNTWQIAEGFVFFAGSYHTIGVAYAANVNAGNTTVTVTNNQGQPTVASLSEWNSGVPGAALGLDQIAGATGTGTSPSSGNVTTTSATELMIGMIFSSNGGLSAGSGWTGLANLLSAEFPEYQIVNSIGSYAATAAATSGTWGAVIATFLIKPLPIFNTLAGRFNTAGILVGNLLVPIWTSVDVSPVTVNANTTSAQDLTSIVVPANTLNSVGRTLRVLVKGVYSTPSGSSATITVKVLLGSLTLLSMVTGANAGSVSNNSFIMEGQITTQTAGASAKFESSGTLTINLGAGTSSVATVYTDMNDAVSGALDSTANQTLQITIAFSVGSGSNSATQRQLILGTVN